MTIFTTPTTFYTLYNSGIYYKMKYITGLLALFANCFLSVKALAQDPEAFSKIYQQVYLEIAPVDMDQAHAVADSLYQISTTPQFKTRSLMLTATLYEHQQQLEKSTQTAERAWELISATDDVSWKVRISGFLASQYRLLQLYKKSKIYCDRALELIPLITQPQAAQSTAGMVHQELAFYYMAAKNYRQAIEHIETSQRNFDQVSQNKNFFQANNEQLLGLNYTHLNQPEKALQHYNQSLALLKEMPDNHVRGLAYNGMSAIYIQQADTVKAKKYLDSASAIAGRSQYLQLKNEVLKTTQSYYLKIKNLAKLEEARQQQDSVREQIAVRNTQFLDSSFVELEKTTAQAQKSSDAKNIPLAAGGLLLLGGGCYFYAYRRKQKQQYERFMIYFEDRKQPVLSEAGGQPSHYEVYTPAAEPETAASHTQEIEESPEAEKDKEGPLLLSEETLQRLLGGLNQFEQELQYISGTITLSQLAAQLNTNTKYLSYVIKTYKERDFNGYINELRVTYIIRLLREQPHWRTYKISVLAEKAGFSSHGKFTTIFKGVTGLSPSVFIQHLENEERK